MGTRSKKVKSLHRSYAPGTSLRSWGKAFAAEPVAGSPDGFRAKQGALVGVWCDGKGIKFAVDV